MSSTKKNIAYNVLYQILVIFIPLITSPYLSRIFGAEGIGIYSYNYSIANYFVLFAMLGISNYGNRSIAAVRDNVEKRSKVFWNLYALQLITSIIIVILYITYITFINTSYPLISQILTIYVISSMFDINWFFFGMGEFKITVVRNAIIKILTLVSIFIFIRSSSDIWKYTLILSIGTLISQSAVWIYVKKYVKYVTPKKRDIISHIKPNLIMFVPVISYSIYKIMDKIMLGKICSVYDVGLYENAEKIINIPQGIIAAIGTVMISKMSNQVQKSSHEVINNYISISIKYMVIISSAICFGLMGIGKKFAPIYFGDEFIKSGIIIEIMSCIVIFISVANVIRTQYLIPYKKDKLYLTSTIVGAILNFIINLILIPYFNIYGAVIGTIVAEFFVMFVQIIGVKNNMKIYKYLFKSTPPLLIGTIMCFIVKVISLSTPQTVLWLVLEIAIGAFIYILLTVIWLVLSKDEVFIKEIKHLKRRVKNV